jgi:hypothetical protein
MAAQSLVTCAPQSQGARGVNAMGKTVGGRQIPPLESYGRRQEDVDHGVGAVPALPQHGVQQPVVVAAAGLAQGELRSGRREMDRTVQTQLTARTAPQSWQKQGARHAPARHAVLRGVGAHHAWPWAVVSFRRRLVYFY